MLPRKVVKYPARVTPELVQVFKDICCNKKKSSKNSIKVSNYPDTPTPGECG